MQGVIASFAKSTAMEQLYGGVALVELSEGLIENLAFAGIFNLGLELGSMTGLGLPFFVITVGLPLLLPLLVDPIALKKNYFYIKLRHSAQIFFVLALGISFFMPTKERTMRLP